MKNPSRSTAAPAAVPRACSSWASSASVRRCCPPVGSGALGVHLHSDTSMSPGSTPLSGVPAAATSADADGPTLLDVDRGVCSRLSAAVVADAVFAATVATARRKTRSLWLLDDIELRRHRHRRPCRRGRWGPFVSRYYGLSALLDARASPRRRWLFPLGRHRPSRRTAETYFLEAACGRRRCATRVAAAIRGRASSGESRALVSGSFSRCLRRWTGTCGPATTSDEHSRPGLGRERGVRSAPGVIAQTHASHCGPYLSTRFARPRCLALSGGPQQEQPSPSSPRL